MTVNDDIVPLRGTGDLRFAIIVDPQLASGLLANTVATIAIGLGARHHGAGNVRMTDSNGVTIFNSADRPVPILQADAAALASLLEKAHAPSTDHSVVAFPAFARSLHSFEEYESVFPERRLMTEKLDGIGLCGPSKWVRSLTGSLKLLR
ncbi:DUF2000 family protein [Falsihalocynthiibacter sp. S25ZX9]|uniref:DUF2000 family protein n=1 Tax=Falsihalocynthiibacter sp. S25ZX9 TaxID=3240870 RepID=UPI00350FEF79